MATRINNQFNLGQISNLYSRKPGSTEFQLSAKRVENFIPMKSGGLERRYGTFLKYIHNKKSRLISYNLDKNNKNILVLQQDRLVVFRCFDFKILADIEVKFIDKEEWLDEIHYQNYYKGIILCHNEFPPKIINNGINLKSYEFENGYPGFDSGNVGDDEGGTTLYQPEQKWFIEDAPLQNVPQHDFNDAYSPDNNPNDPTTDIAQEYVVDIVLKHSSARKMDIIFNIDGQWSPRGDAYKLRHYQDTTTHEQNAGRIENAIKQIEGIDPDGVTVEPDGVAWPSGDDEHRQLFRITLGGANAGPHSGLGIKIYGGTAGDYPGLSSIKNNFISVKGEKIKESIFGSRRGYPGVSAIFNNRLYFSKFKYLQTWILASKIGSFFDFENLDNSDDEGFFVQVASVDDAKIQAIRAHTNLLVFTTNAEYYCPQNLITPKTFQIVKCSANGIKEDTNICSIGNDVVFIDNDGTKLNLFTKREETENYQAYEISYFTDLIKNPHRITVNNSLNYVFIVNEDGTITALHYVKQTDTYAFFVIKNDNLNFKDVCCVGEFTYFIAQDKDTELEYILEYNKDASFDCEVKLENKDLIQEDGLTELNFYEDLIFSPVGYVYLVADSPSGPVYTDTEAYNDYAKYGYFREGNYSNKQNTQQLLTAFKNKTASVFGNQFLYGEYENGNSFTIELEQEYEDVRIGLDFKPEVETNEVFVSEDFTRKTRISSVGISFVEALGLYVEVNKREYKVNMQTFDNLYTEPQKITGDKKIRILGRSEAPTIIIKQKYPFKGTKLISINIEVK